MHRLWFCAARIDEGTSKTFTCARPLVGQFVAIQLVGVEGSLSLCEVEVFSNDGKCKIKSTHCPQSACFSNDILFVLAPFLSIMPEFSTEQCEAPNLNADTVLQSFARTCYEFHVTRGESFDKAQQICKSHGNHTFFALNLSLNWFFFGSKKVPLIHLANDASLWMYFC